MTTIRHACYLFLLHCVQISYGQLCSSANGLGKCSGNVLTCVFQNGYPAYFTSAAQAGECSLDEFCCVNLPRPEDGSCANRCGISGSVRSKGQGQDDPRNKNKNNIKLDNNYNWTSIMPNPQAQERSARIVNGSDVDKYEFCWQGGVFVVDTEQLQNNSRSAVPIYIGGASLVAQDMALTAAHVLQPFITNANFIIFVAFGFRSLSAVTGVMNGSVSWDELPAMRVPNEMAFHSGYNDRTYENNIAIIRFNPISCESGNICPICLSSLPANPFQPWKGTCQASGWGATATSAVAPILQKLEMVIPYPNECLKSFQKLGLKNYDLPSTMLCADAAPGFTGGTCDRDGGSPLVCQTKYGNWELTGIVGVGINRCRQVGAPTLFTNVGYYYEWIQSYSRGSYRDYDAFSTTLAPMSNVSVTNATENEEFSNSVYEEPINGTLPAEEATVLEPKTQLMATTTPQTVNTQSSLRKTTQQAPAKLEFMISKATPGPRATWRMTRRPAAFQFSTPKIFVPKNKVTLTDDQKLAQAFFQERNDMATDEQMRAPPNRPETFSVLVPSSNANRLTSDSNLESPAGTMKFILRPTDTFIKRKPQDSFKPVDSGLFDTVPTISEVQTTVAPEPEQETQPETTTLKTTTSQTTRTFPTTFTTTSTSTSISTTKRSTSSPTSTTTQKLNTASTSSPVSRTVPNKVFFDATRPKRPTTTANSTSVTTSLNNKIYVKIRHQDDSILSYLRKRYKDSKLYTDLTTASTARTTDTAVSTSQTSTTTTSTGRTFAPIVSTASSTKPSSTTTRTTAGSTTSIPSSTLRGVLVTKYLDPLLSRTNTTTFPKLRTEWFTRPTGPSVML